jgi:YfiH family protein
VTHAFCTRRQGVSDGPYESLNTGFLSGDDAGRVRKNLSLVRRAFAVPEEGLVLMRQVHGSRILMAADPAGPDREAPECDGLITDRPGLALAVRTADCVPLFFVDPVRRVIGAAHAGWRGTALGIAGAMVEMLAGRFGSRREDLLAAIGPAIGPCCYQVDAPVFEAFSPLAGRGGCLQPCPEGGRWMLDLAMANRFQIEQAGVPAGNVSAAGFCTACLPDLFFSHRGSGGQAGRQINLLMLRPGERAKNA